MGGACFFAASSVILKGVRSLTTVNGAVNRSSMGSILALSVPQGSRAARFEKCECSRPHARRLVFFWVTGIGGGGVMFESFNFQDVAIYLVAILSLVVVWQYYQMQVMAGRILAVDIFDRSGIRMYLYVVPEGDDVCEVCSAANGRVFLPSQVAKKGFSPLKGDCQRTVPCLGTLVGLYGAWVEARGVVERLRANANKGGIRLTPEELRALVNGPWEQSISADTDRVVVRMLEAACYEKINQVVSISGYRYVIDEVKEVRHLLLLVPAYLRLVQLMARAGDGAQALEIIDRFELRFPVTKRGPHYPTKEQRSIMKTRKALLLDTRQVKVAA